MPNNNNKTDNQQEDALWEEIGHGLDGNGWASSWCRTAHSVHRIRRQVKKKCSAMFYSQKAHYRLCAAVINLMVLGNTLVIAETVGINGNLYSDTGKSSSSCTRHVTVEGEGDCYYSLKRLISGTGISNMNARGAFVNTNGELVKYESANNDGQWKLSSVDKMILRLHKL